MATSLPCIAVLLSVLRLLLECVGAAETASDPINSTYVPQRAKSIAAGGKHSLFLTEDGEAFAAGENDCGQLADGSSVDRNVPKASCLRFAFLRLAEAHADLALHNAQYSHHPSPILTLTLPQKTAGL